MADMIKFYKGAVGSLPTAGVNGALYITTDEGGIYLGTGTGLKRLGDFIQVDKAESLPEKAHESCLYYCVAENILAKWNGTEWKQINKQPTADEMKTLLGLGSMAYKSEVAEGDLNADLKAKVNAAAEGNHSHSNKGVLDGITADKVAAWDASEGNAKTYADGLNTAMNTRVEALEAIDHEHANKALLDTYTQTEADLADAVSKKHSHANADELAKFVDGDRARYEAVVADHLTSADKTTLENSIKEAKKAGTDANTALEAYKVTNDARVLAVEEDVAEIVDGTNGILAQAKSYSDGKLATARTEISAEIDADVKVVADDLAGYKTSNDTALAGVKATADAAAVKTEVETALAGKVDKVEGKSLISDSEITRLAGVTNYDDTQVKADIAKKADAETMTTELGKKVDKVEGYSLVSDTEIARLAGVSNYDDTALAGRVTTAEGKITALEGASATHATKDELKNVDDKFANYVLSESYATDKQGIEEAIADRYTKSEADGKFALIADAYDDTALSNRVKAIEDDYLVEADKTELAGLVTAEKERAEGIEGGLRTDVDVIKGDYLKGSDKTELEGKITAEETRAKGVEESLQTQINTIMNNPDAEGAINSINEFTQYVKDHGTIADGFRTDIDKNKEDIAANAGNISTLTDSVNRIDADYASMSYVDNKFVSTENFETEIAKDRARLSTLEAIDHDAYVDADEALKFDLQAEIDADVQVVSDELTGYMTSNNAAVALKANSADVYAKTETFTKDEVNAAIAAAVEAAHTWGEF